MPAPLAPITAIPRAIPAGMVATGVVGVGWGLGVGLGVGLAYGYPYNYGYPYRYGYPYNYGYAYSSCYPYGYDYAYPNGNPCIGAVPGVVITQPATTFIQQDQVAPAPARVTGITARIRRVTFLTYRVATGRGWPSFRKYRQICQPHPASRSETTTMESARLPTFLALGVALVLGGCAVAPTAPTVMVLPGTKRSPHSFRLTAFPAS